MQWRRAAALLCFVVTFVALLPGIASAQAALGPAPAPPSAIPALPDGSGTGRRVVYSNGSQRVWLVGDDGIAFDSWLVSGRRGVPRPGVYAVYSRSPVSTAHNGSVTMQYMVRFARGRTLAIGFHSIPVRRNGSPIQTLEQLGTYRSSGCVRQRVEDAAKMWGFADLGTPVVVVA